MESKSAGERGSGSDEGPRVTTTSGFEMSQFEVTREAFGNVMSRRELGGLPDWPVASVDFEECCLFCNRLSERFGFDISYSGMGKDVVCDFSANGFRLPTEAEWEYACRAGTTSIYYTGDEAFGDCQPGDPEYLECAAWFKNNSNGRVHSVGELAPSAFGLFDTHGNVWEWCWDFYDERYYASTQLADPRGLDKGTRRVVRGGSYTSYKQVRDADRPCQLHCLQHQLNDLTIDGTCHVRIASPPIHSPVPQVGRLLAEQTLALSQNR